MVDLKKESMNKVNLRKEILTVTLKKKNVPKIKARVALVLDKSGSMSNLYRDGTVQSILERIFPLALEFDDNGELDLWLFNNRLLMLEPVTKDNFYNYVETKIMTGVASNFWGGTEYTPVMQSVFEKYAISEHSDVPSFVIFITDGDNSDKTNTEMVLIESSKYNIFWQYVGIGNEEFGFLKRLDNLKGRKIDNANFFSVSNIQNITDEKLYESLMNEYPSWEEEFKKGVNEVVSTEPILNDISVCENARETVSVENNHNAESFMTRLKRFLKRIFNL